MYDRIYDIVKTIPSGSVASYGAVAKAAGYFRGARLVGWALGQLPIDTPVPWHRVVNREGVLSIVNPRISKTLQQERLQTEGIEVVEEAGRLVVKNPLWWQEN